MFPLFNSSIHSPFGELIAVYGFKVMISLTLSIVNFSVSNMKHITEVHNISFPCLYLCQLQEQLLRPNGASGFLAKAL